MGSAAAAISAAIFGPGVGGLLRPAGGFAHVDEGEAARSLPSLALPRANSGASCVQPMVSGPPVPQ